MMDRNTNDFVLRTCSEMIKIEYIRVTCMTLIGIFPNQIKFIVDSMWPAQLWPNLYIVFNNLVEEARNTKLIKTLITNFQTFILISLFASGVQDSQPFKLNMWIAFASGSVFVNLLNLYFATSIEKKIVPTANISHRFLSATAAILLYGELSGRMYSSPETLLSQKNIYVELMYSRYLMHILVLFYMMRYVIMMGVFIAMYRGHIHDFWSGNPSGLARFFMPKEIEVLDLVINFVFVNFFMNAFSEYEMNTVCMTVRRLYLLVLFLYRMRLGYDFASRRIDMAGIFFWITAYIFEELLTVQLTRALRYSKKA